MYLYLKDVKLNYLEIVIEFIYRGKILISQEDLESFLSAATSLKVIKLK